LIKKMWSNLAKTGLGAALITSTAVYYRDDIRLRAATLIDTPPSYNSNRSQYGGEYPEIFPRSKWNKNWDFREPLSLVNPELYAKADEATRQEMIQKATPTAIRNIFLIRHGQYHLESDKKHLTDLGREQATLLGKRLASMDQKFDSLVMSTMCRATETANLILEELPVPFKSDSILEEGLPYPTEPPIERALTTKQFVTDGTRIEAAFRKYIHRASVKQKKDSWELIVCHANVIRYFVCRIMQVGPEAWLRLSLGNCSVTWLAIHPNGTISIRVIGDIGHFPKGKISFT